MPRILAIDWDRHEVRGLLISSGATGTSVTGAWTASLATVDPAGLGGKQIGGRLAAAIAGKVSGKPATLIGVGRDNVQIKLLMLPPAPAEELPDLVRFQAEREFTALGLDAALDFVAIAGDEQAPHQVLAVALSPEGLTEAREICQSLDVELGRIPLRGCAAAALASRAGAIGDAQVALIVNPLAEEADLAVQADDKVILIRTVRLPDASQAESRQRALLGEIRRTIAAVRQQLTERQVSKVIVCGNDASIGGKSALGDDLEMPVVVLDPVEQAPAGLAAKGIAPESLGRFAAVLGMALGEADRRPPIVDFANVRKRAEVRRFSRVHILAAAAAATVVLAIGFYLWQQLAAPARELANLQNQTREVEAKADKFKEVVTQANLVNRWSATDVNYLDEMVQMAQRVRPKPLLDKNFPVNNDAVTTDLTISRPTGIDAAGGKIVLKGVAKSSAAVKEMEDRIRDDDHHIASGAGNQDKTTVPGYGWSFLLDVFVDKPEESVSGGAKP